MQRVIFGIVAAWVVGTCAATVLLWSRSGIVAFNLLPVFAVVLAVWLLCVGAVAVHRRRRGAALVGWMYFTAVISALVAALVFFVLFAHPFMVCIPVGMFASAPVFQVVMRGSRHFKSSLRATQSL